MLLFPTKPHMPTCLQDPEEPERRVQQRFSQKQSTVRNSKDGEPCNECEMCRSITAGTQEDVIEIDAASNNGVEEIRFIRDRANYAPTKAARTKCTLLMRYICFQQELSMPC